MSGANPTPGDGIPDRRAWPFGDALNYTHLGISYHPTAAGQAGGYYPVFRGAAG
ncbi:hypothetical protein [Micromonospora sp. IBHARD004]|uniref:hypothetical protein n=1 Tax=Micromonospora sp. IBHARD004 TaxID=3457764 RepID=UPI0040581768